MGHKTKAKQSLFTAVTRSPILVNVWFIVMMSVWSLNVIFPSCDIQLKLDEILLSNGTSYQEEELPEIISTPNEPSAKVTSTTDDVPLVESSPDSTSFIISGSKEHLPRRKPSKKKSLEIRKRSKAETLLSVFWSKPGFCLSNQTYFLDNRPLKIAVEKEDFELKKTVVEDEIGDDNASVVDPKISDENDQLETYNQFAERLSAEKKNGGTNGQTPKGSKVKSKKNYASPDCGAKLAGANHEASHSHKIIVPNKDEYMLNKCTDKIWAVVELCESIRPQKFDVANFELFSNSPKNINLYGSHRYSARDWTPLGTYEGAQGNRGIQSFNIETEEFFKYIKLEVVSHYGTEFFCPISLLRIYGLSEFEVIDQLEEPEDASDEETVEDERSKDKGGMIPTVIKSVFSGMMNVIKRGSVSHSWPSERNKESCISLQKNLQISKELCFMADSLNYILAYYYDEYDKLMLNPFLAATFRNSYFCRELANISCSTTADINDSLVYDTICNNSYACVMLSPKHVLAMCYMHNPRILHELSLCANISSSGHADNSSDTLNPHEEKLATINNGSFDAVESSDRRRSNHNDEGSRPDEAGVKEGNNNLDAEKGIHKHPKGDMKKKKKEDSESKLSKKQQPKKEISNSPKAVNGTVTSQEKVKSNMTKKDTQIVIDTNDKPTTAIPSVDTPSSSSFSSASGERVAVPSNKESIMVRLSNKVKALEENMSISSQYLEELSRRYKRQMEEMQNQFNATIRTMNLTAVEKRVDILESKLDNLADRVSQMEEKMEDILYRAIQYHLIFVMLQVLILWIAFSFCLSRNRDAGSMVVRQNGFLNHASEHSPPSPSVAGGRGSLASHRRGSFSSSREAPTNTVQRRSLGHEVEITGTCRNVLVPEERRSRRKRSNLKKATSNHDLKNRSLSSGPLEKLQQRPKRSTIAGVLFGNDYKGSSNVEGVEQDWCLIYKGKPLRKKSEKLSEGLCQNSSEDCPVKAVVINGDRYPTKEVTVPQLPITAAEPTWSPELLSLPLSSTPLPKSSLTMDNARFFSNTAASSELVSIAKNVDISVKKSKKKKKSRSIKEGDTQVPVKICSSCF